MKIYKIYQNKNTGYDTYDSAIVAAENEKEAKQIHPNGDLTYEEKGDDEFADENYGSWVKHKFVKVKYIGEAAENIKKGVIVESYNAG